LVVVRVEKNKRNIVDWVIILWKKF
jgi:hypothetical protein